MNGANGSTLDQRRGTLGFGASEIAEINEGYRGLMSLEKGLDPTTTFQIANSVWYRQDLPVHQAFIDAVRSTFDTEVNASPFDASTVAQVNAWVSDKTSGKIPTILDGIDPHPLIRVSPGVAMIRDLPPENGNGVLHDRIEGRESVLHPAGRPRQIHDQASIPGAAHTA